MFEIDEGGDDQAGDEHRVNQGGRHGGERVIRAAEAEPAGQEREAGEQFDDEVTGGDRCAAVSATAPQPQPGYQWKVEIKRDRIFAMWAVRRRGHNAQAPG